MIMSEFVPSVELPGKLGCDWRWAWRLAVIGWGVFMVGGCAPGDGEGISRSEAHASPLHYPENFADNVDRLRQLLERMSVGNWSPLFSHPEEAGKTSGPASALAELLDLIEWLPHQAAASDLGEGDWLIARRVSSDLMRQLETLTTLSEPQQMKQFSRVAPEIGVALETLVPVVAEFHRLEERYRPQELEFSADPVEDDRGGN
jgi:hypothetical protein